MNKKVITVEIVIYALIVIIGFSLRFAKLGEIPLSDYEASLALEAKNLISSGNKLQSDQVFLTNMIGSLFFLFGAENFVARFIPMLAGSFLILVPLFFRQYINRKLLLLISFWIAISPTLVSLSRQVDSSMLFLISISLFAFFILKNKPIPSSLFLVISLLSGSIFYWSAALVFLVFIYVISFGNNMKRTTINVISKYKKTFNTRMFLISFLVSYVLLSTFGFVYSQQFNGITRGLIGFIDIIKKSNIDWNLGLVTRSLLFYELAVIIFGIFGLFWLLKKQRLVGLSVFGLLTINIIFIMLAREKSLVWNIYIVMPLIVSGSYFLSEFLTLPKPEKEKTLIISAAGLSILIFIGLAFARMFVDQNQSGEQASLRLIYILAGLVLIIGAGLLGGWVIGWKIAGRSFLIVSTIIFLIFTISSTWNGAGLRKPIENELLRIDKIPIEEDLLMDTIKDFSSWNYGNDTSINVLVLNNEMASLKWALRRIDNVTFQNVIPRGKTFDVIISGDDQIIEQLNAYRGQDIKWYSTPQWETMGMEDISKWILTRRTTQDLDNQKSLIIWIRNSLVPGFENNT